jgi:hypothetical protein
VTPTNIKEKLVAFDGLLKSRAILWANVLVARQAQLNAVSGERVQAALVYETALTRFFEIQELIEEYKYSLL